MGCGLVKALLQAMGLMGRKPIQQGKEAFIPLRYRLSTFTSAVLNDR